MQTSGPKHTGFFHSQVGQVITTVITTEIEMNNTPRAIKTEKNETLETVAPNPANMNGRALI